MTDRTQAAVERGSSVNLIPIFVCGSARNGTTWLCNVLSNHPDVVAAQHQAHWGFHESNVFKNYRYWGGFSDLQKLLSFARLYSGADHARLIGCSQESILAAAPEDFYDAFLAGMDQFARRQGKRFWVTKMDPLIYLHPRELGRLVERLKTRYPEVRFVGVQRNLPDVLQSYLNMAGRAEQRRTSRFRAPLFVLFETARYVVHYRRIRTLLRRLGAPLVSYDQLKSNTAVVLGRLCDSIGISYDDSMLQPRFQPNSSLAYRDAGRTRKIGAVSGFVARFLLQPILRLFWPVTVLMLQSREQLRPGRPPVYYKLAALEQAPERFRRELIDQDDTGLVQILFPDTSDTTGDAP